MPPKVFPGANGPPSAPSAVNGKIKLDALPQKPTAAEVGAIHGGSTATGGPSVAPIARPSARPSVAGRAIAAALSAGYSPSPKNGVVEAPAVQDSQMLLAQATAHQLQGLGVSLADRPPGAVAAAEVGRRKSLGTGAGGGGAPGIIGRGGHLLSQVAGVDRPIEVDDIFPVWFFHPWARIFTACWVILADMVMVSSRSCAAISSTQAD